MEEEKNLGINEETIKEAEALLEPLNLGLSVEQELAKLQEENSRLKDQALRAMAEAENLRKRTEREIEENTKYAVTGFARDLIQVLENLHRAEASIPETEETKSYREGITLTRKELEKIFEKNGIRRIEPVGEKFDHNFHQAVTQLENTEVEPGTVLQVLQAGYVIRDRLLRPAIVTVSK